MTGTAAVQIHQADVTAPTVRVQFSGYREIVAFHRPQHKQEHGMSSTPVIPRTKSEPNYQWLKDNVRIKARLADAIEQDHGHKHSHLKLIARETGASPRTVEKWKDAQYLMGVEHFLRLVPTSPSLQKMLAELMTLDSDTDPRHAVLLGQIRRLG